MKPIPALEQNAGLPVRERGVISILMAFLLVAGVIFILAQTMGIVGTRSTDTSQQLDSTAALMLAESGLQRAEAIVGRSGNSGIMAEADCTGIATAAARSPWDAAASVIRHENGRGSARMHRGFVQHAAR